MMRLRSRVLAQATSFLIALAVCVAAGRASAAAPQDPQQVVDGPSLDGSDDAPAIQRAIDAISGRGGIVRIRAGVYRLDIRNGTHALTPRPNVRLVGDGPGKTILRVSGGLSGYKSIFYPEPVAADLSGFGLQDLTVDQNTASSPIGSQRALVDMPRTVLIVFAGSNVRVDNCEFRDVAGTNTLVFNGPNVSDIWVTNNQFNEVGNSVAVHFDHSTVYTHADGVHITGNVFRGRIPGGGAFGATTAIETHGSRQIVTGNIVEGYFSGMNITGVAAASDNVFVSENTVSGAAIGMQLWSRFYGSNKTLPALTNVVVSRNTIGIDRDAWVGVAGTPGLVAAGIAVEPHGDAGFDRIRIDGNTIRFMPSGQPTTSDDQSAGIELWLSDATVVSRNVSVTNNEISGSYGPGIRLSMSGYGTDIAHNVVRDASQSSAAFPEPFHSAIMVSHLQHGLAIHDNFLVDDQPTTTLRFGVLDATTEASTGLRAVDNQVRVSAATVPAFQNSRGGGAFFVSYVVDSPPVLPTYPVASGSTITDTSTAKTLVQVDSPAGTTWKSLTDERELPKNRTGSRPHD